MKVNYSLSSQTDSRGKAQIMMRLNATRRECWRGKTKLFITPDNWDEASGLPKTTKRDAIDKRECHEIGKRLNELTAILIERYNEDIIHDKDWLKRIVSNIQWQDDGSIKLLSESSIGNMTLSDSLAHMVSTMLADKVIVKSSAETYLSLHRKFSKFESKRHRLLVKEFNESILEEMIRYFKENYNLADNTIYHLKRNCLRWWHWCRSHDKRLPSIVGDNIKVRATAYGTPYYLTKEERDKLYHTHMSEWRTEEVKNIFIFQCLVGCRISDLLKFTKDNIRDGKLVYIAQKTIHSEPQTISVPLHPIAQEIVDKYKGRVGTLFPHRVNRTLVLRLRQAIIEAGIDRVVTIRDKHSGLQVQRWLSEIASTHMARRTFIGCLYEQGYRESDICSMSGHKEGSISIQRYRAVSDERKKKMIDSI